MSGGSYEYLCFKDAADLLEASEQLRAMADRLKGVGHADDAARETEDIIATVEQFQESLNARITRISEVWRAVEWWDSGDTNENHLHHALKEYRIKK